MSNEREVTIVIRGKNLTQAEFSAARKELAGVDDQAKKTSLSASTLGTAFKAMGAAISIGAITGALKSYADLTGQLTDLSAKTGIGVEALQRLQYAAEQNGGSLEQVTGAITKLGSNLAGGNESAVGALKALGLSFDTIRGMAPDKAFTTIADAIAKIPDPMAQSKLAMDLFGKSGADLLPMMKGNLSETAAAADRLGIVLSEDAVRAGDEFGDTMGTLAAVGKSVIGQVLQPMIPVLTTVAQWLGEKLPGAVKFVVDALSIGFARAWIDARILFNQFLLGIAEGINKIPLLGEKIGFSAQTIAGLRANVQQAKDTLTIFTEQTIATSSTHEKAARTVGTLNLNYAENEKAARRATAANKELDPSVQRLVDSFRKQIEAHEKLRNTPVTPAIFEGFRHMRLELTEGQPIVARSIQDSVKAKAEAQQWAETHSAVLAPAFKATGLAIKDAGGQTTEANDSLRLLADGFVRLGQVSGGSFGALLGDIGQVVVNLDNVQRGAGVASGMFKEGAKASERFASALASIATVAQGVQGIMASTSKEVDSFKNTMNGAGEGAKAGSAFGGYGAAIGAVVGAFTGYIRAHLNAQEATMALRTEASKLREEFNETYGNVVQMYETLGPVDERARALGITMNWVPKTKLEFKLLNDQIKQFGDINARISGAAAQAATGLTAVVDAMAAPWVELGTRLDGAVKKAKETGEAYKTALAEGSSPEQLAKLKQAADDASIAVLELQTHQATMAVGGKQQLADLGVQALSTFAGAIAAGDSFNVALGKIGPTLVTLGEAHKALGLEVEDAALKQLLAQSQIAANNPALIAGTQGLGSSMQALAQMGLLNEESFAAMQRTGQAMYVRLQAEAEKTGAGSRGALLPMQDYLQQAATEAKLLGIPLDANTQMLIDQSKELGIWKETGASANDRIIAGIETLIGKVGELISGILGVSQAASNIPKVPAPWDGWGPPPSIPDYGGGGGGGEEGTGGERPYALGTFGTHGYDFPDFGGGTRAILHNREAVVPYEQRFDFAQRVMGGVASAAAPVNVYILNKDGQARQVSQSDFMLEQQVQSLFDQGRITVPERVIASRTGR